MCVGYASSYLRLSSRACPKPYACTLSTKAQQLHCCANSLLSWTAPGIISGSPTWNGRLPERLMVIRRNPIPLNPPFAPRSAVTNHWVISCALTRKAMHLLTIIIPRISTVRRRMAPPRTCLCDDSLSAMSDFLVHVLYGSTNFICR